VKKKRIDCNNCNDLAARMERLEKRLERQEDLTSHWQKRWRIVDTELRVARGRISILEAENGKLKKTVEKRDATIKGLQKLLFASSSEVTKVSEDKNDALIMEVSPKRPRGKQPGTKGFGRKVRDELPVQEVCQDVALAKKCCQECGLKKELLPFTEDSEEIHYSYSVVRVKHKRLKYRKVCKCISEPAVVTAPVPDKLIPKGLFSTEFWAHVLLEKFLLQRPISRVCMSLSLHGLDVSEGTVASGLKQLTKLFAPLYNAIRAQMRVAKRWQMDETHWQVFTDVMGKSNHKWWLWVTETDDTTLFTLDPTRSSAVPKKLLSELENGVLTCDRYSAYAPVAEQGILISYCWAHVRRDFIRVRDGFPALSKFAAKWIQKIDELFFIHGRRKYIATADQDLRDICELMERDARKALKRKTQHAEARAVLVSLMKHWTGLTLFLEHPSLPLDNNASERALRNPVVGRKNYYGSRSIWSGCLSSMLFSIFATLQKNKVDPRQYLIRYLKECAKNKGRPLKNLDSFLPWETQQSNTAASLHG
jgi:transposase